MEMQVANGIHVRWMCRKDMPMVESIEAESFDHPWRQDDFIRCMQQRNVIGMVAEQGDLVVGFMIYELHKNRLHLLNFAVNPRFRRQGIGSAMIDKLTSKLSYERRRWITLEIRETNLEGQLFFKSKGFRAISVLTDFWEDSPEDAYLMSYRHNAPPELHHDGRYFSG